MCILLLNQGTIVKAFQRSLGLPLSPQAWFLWTQQSLMQSPHFQKGWWLLGNIEVRPLGALGITIWNPVEPHIGNSTQQGLRDVVTIPLGSVLAKENQSLSLRFIGICLGEIYTYLGPISLPHFFSFYLFSFLLEAYDLFAFISSQLERHFAWQ